MFLILFIAFVFCFIKSFTDSDSANKISYFAPVITSVILAISICCSIPELGQTLNMLDNARDLKQYVPLLGDGADEVLNAAEQAVGHSLLPKINRGENLQKAMDSEQSFKTASKLSLIISLIFASLCVYAYKKRNTNRWILLIGFIIVEIFVIRSSVFVMKYAIDGISAFLFGLLKNLDLTGAMIQLGIFVGIPFWVMFYNGIKHLNIDYALGKPTYSTTDLKSTLKNTASAFLSTKSRDYSQRNNSGNRNPLVDNPAEPQSDICTRLRNAKEMYDAGIIDESEFIRIKQNIIQS